MALLQIGTMSGMESAFNFTLATALTSGLVSGAFLAASMSFWTNNRMAGAFTRLTYDLRDDVVIVTNGIAASPTYTYPYWVWNLVNSAVSVTGLARQPITHVVIPAATLSPSSGGEITALGASQQFFPGDGGGEGFSIDPTTTAVYQHWWQFAVATPRGGGTALGYGYGATHMVSTTGAPFGAGFSFQETWDGSVNGEQVIASAMLTTAGRRGRVHFAPGAVLPPLPAVFLDDVVVFVYADLGGVGWISCRDRPASTVAAATWRGTRSMPFGWPMALAPVGVDRVLALWWSTPTHGAPLVYTLFRYDRILERLRLEDMGDVPTPYTYVWPVHVGYATYDIRRGRVLLLSPNPNSIDGLGLTQFCHPGVARTIEHPVPVDPGLAGYDQRYTVLTHTTGTNLPAPRIVVSAPGIASTAFVRVQQAFATDGIQGNGTYAVTWASTASGVSGAFTLGLSSYSVVLCATYAKGLAYGTEGMALLTSTATFTVSTTLTATTTAQVTITPRIPVSQADAVGAGSPRLLSYPTSALATPYFYANGFNPHTWTNMGTSPLTSPLYATTRTLSRTVFAQFAGHVTDLEVTETWIGGGPGRIAMPLSMFAALWDMYANVPDFASAGYLTWEPRDISNRKYQVILTSLTVGGQSDGVLLNHLYKAGSWISETVEMKLRIIGEV